MGEISILRPRRSLVSIPVVEAVYCESCASVSNSSGGCCGVCGNRSPFAAGRVGAAATEEPEPRSLHRQARPAWSSSPWSDRLERAA